MFNALVTDTINVQPPYEIPPVEIPTTTVTPPVELPTTTVPPPVDNVEPTVVAEEVSCLLLVANTCSLTLTST